MRGRIKPQWFLLATLPVLLLVVLFVTRGPASTPPAAAATSVAPPINGITCDPTDHGGHRISVHLTIMTNGQARDIMANVGAVNALVSFPSGGPEVTSADCYYWLHTGKDDGVIHADPPTARSFTLGDFFDIWHQPLGTDAVASDEGPVTSYVNGQLHTGNPRTIPLTDHEVIQLDVTR